MQDSTVVRGMGFDAGEMWPLGYIPPHARWVTLSKSLDI